MNHSKHSYLVIGLAAVGAVLFFSGVDSGVVFLLWPLACTAMMVALVWGMGGIGCRGDSSPSEHTQDDGLTHSHDSEPALGIPGPRRTATSTSEVAMEAGLFPAGSDRSRHAAQAGRDAGGTC